MKVKSLGELIREARKLCGISQSAMSARIGAKSDSYISRVERGKAPLSPRHFAKVSDLLHIGVDELVKARVSEEERRIRSKIGEK